MVGVFWSDPFGGGCSGESGFGDCRGDVFGFFDHGQDVFIGGKGEAMFDRVVHEVDKGFPKSVYIDKNKRFPRETELGPGHDFDRFIEGSEAAGE